MSLLVPKREQSTESSKLKGKTAAKTDDPLVSGGAVAIFVEICIDL